MILSTENINSLQPAAIRQDLSSIQNLNIHDDNPILTQSPPLSTTPTTSSSPSTSFNQDHLNNNSSKGIRERLSPITQLHGESPNRNSPRSSPQRSSCSPILRTSSHQRSNASPSLYSSPAPASSASFPSSASYSGVSGIFSSPCSVADSTSSKIASMIMQQIQPEPENLHLSFDRDREDSESYREHSSGGVSPPPSPAPTHLSSSPTLPTMLGNSLGGGPPTLPPTQPLSPPITSSGGSSGGSSNGERGAGGLASLHHAIHGLHNLHSLQNLQNQMAALAGLQGGAGLGLVPPPAPSPAPHGGVSSLLHPHLHQTGSSMGSSSPASNAVAAATSAALAAAASNAVSGTGSTGATGSSSIAAAGSNGSLGNGGPSGAMPQMVLTSGQVMQGVQGAQLLIPTSQGVAVQPILTITLGQAGPIASTQTTGGLGSTLNQLHHLHPTHQTQPVQPPHHSIHSGGSAASSPLPTSSSSSTSPSSVSNPHPLLGLAAGLPPSLFHHHSHHNNNNNNSATNNNNSIRSCSPDKPKLPLSMASPVGGEWGKGSDWGELKHLRQGHEDTVPELPYRRYPSQHDFHTVSGLQARLGASHFPTHPPPPSHPSRYSPDFLDNHNQPTISQAGTNMVDGVNLDEIKEFAKAFKMRRLSLGLTQTQVGQALSITEGPAYSQSAICRYKNGGHTLTDFMGNEPTKKRKRRTSFTPQALEILNAHFERNTHPSGAEITAMGEQLGYEREVVRIWFCNKRQALKNTVRMMAKGSGAPGSQPPTGPPPLPPQPQLN